MKTIAYLLLLFIAAMALNHISAELKHGNDLREQELLLHQIEIISTQCESKSGSVDFETGDLKCDAKKQAAQRKFRPAEMPNEI